MEIVKIIVLLVLFSMVAYLLLYRKRKPVETVKKEVVLEHYEYGLFDLKVIAEINVLRQLNGLNRLVPDSILFSLAGSHSSVMAKECIASHDGYGDRCEIMKPKRIGEVVAFGYIMPESVVNAWTESESHKACLLNEIYTKIGVSHHIGQDGKKYVCAVLME
jgi:uncharacterized protein YkwD